MTEIITKAESIINALEKSGYEAYLVGGIVRDSIMGRECHDADITTNATPFEVKNVFCGLNVIETGIKHGTVTVMLDGIPFEVTTFRIEKGYADSRHPDKIEFAARIEDDLSRRDFTMNSIAYNEARGYIDPFGGRDDIEKRIIRCVGDAAERFNEDALRILRALRFSSELGFCIDEQTATAAFECKDRLAFLSKERIASEVLRALCGKNIRRVLLEYADIFAEIFPNIKIMKGFDQQNEHHCYDLLEHTAAVVESIRPEPYMRLAALLHDYGKCECFTVGEDGVGHFYSHASIGAALAFEKMKELKLDNATVEKVHKLIKIHDSPIEESEKAIKKKLNRYGEPLLLDLIELQRADNLGQSEKYRYRQKHFDELERIIDDVLSKNECFSVRSLQVNGNDMLELGLKGREIGKALELLVEAVIDGKVENQKKLLLNYIKSYEKI